MVARRPASRVHAQGPVASDQPVVVVESKLVPPPARRGMVARTALLDRLEASGSVPVVAIRGPAGYGKTTLLAQWAALDGRPFAWVSIDEHDNDPAVLLTHLAAALDRDEPIDQAVFGALASPGASITRTGSGCAVRWPRALSRAARSGPGRPARRPGVPRPSPGRRCRSRRASRPRR